jgi:transcriptional regulator with XRE-family HTH domain
VLDLKDRLIEVRNAHNKTQDEMSKLLHVGRSTYACWESGTRDIKDRYVDAICREFGVSEEWLRTGEGEMFKEDDFAYDLGTYAAKATELDKAIITEWMKLDDSTKHNLYEFMKKVVDSSNK